MEIARKGFAHDLVTNMLVEMTEEGKTKWEDDLSFTKDQRLKCLSVGESGETSFENITTLNGHAIQVKGVRGT